MQLYNGGLWGGEEEEKEKKEDWQQMLAQVPIFREKKEKSDIDKYCMISSVSAI